MFRNDIWAYQSALWPFICRGDDPRTTLRGVGMYRECTCMILTPHPKSSTRPGGSAKSTKLTESRRYWQNLMSSDSLYRKQHSRYNLRSGPELTAQRRNDHSAEDKALSRHMNASCGHVYRRNPWSWAASFLLLLWMRWKCGLKGVDCYESS